jgi:hypothetical protein
MPPRRNPPSATTPATAPRPGRPRRRAPTRRAAGPERIRQRVGLRGAAPPGRATAFRRLGLTPRAPAVQPDDSGAAFGAGRAPCVARLPAPRAARCTRSPPPDPRSTRSPSRATPQPGAAPSPRPPPARVGRSPTRRRCAAPALPPPHDRRPIHSVYPRPVLLRHRPGYRRRRLRRAGLLRATSHANYGWLSARDMVRGLALAETTPGPLIMVVQFVARILGG